MQATMEVGYIEREVLPRSVWPGLVNQGINAKGTGHNKRISVDLPESSAGVWLPSHEHSMEDYETLCMSVLHELSVFDSNKNQPNAHTEDELHLVQGIAKTLKVDRKGCWRRDDGFDAPSLYSIAEYYHYNPPLEESIWIDDIRQCGNDDCHYPRHFDFTLASPSGARNLVAPNLALFSVKKEEVEMINGDKLPSVVESRIRLSDLQKRCYPYQPLGKSVLTLTSIGQLSFIPATGCWFGRRFYQQLRLARLWGAEKQLRFNVNGEMQFDTDSYSRLRIPTWYLRELMEEDVPVTIAPMLGHRAVWLAQHGDIPDPSEKVLNHLCSFRPCCNDGHIVSVSQEHNIRHAVRVAHNLKHSNQEALFNLNDV